MFLLWFLSRVIGAVIKVRRDEKTLITPTLADCSQRLDVVVLQSSKADFLDQITHYIHENARFTDNNSHSPNLPDPIDHDVLSSN
jgi:hypothetical protein